MQFTKNLLQKFRLWVLGEIPQPKVYHMTHSIRPLSVERLNWLRERRLVLEPLLNSLRTYAYSSPGNTGNGGVQDAIKEASTELLLLDAEVALLADHFESVKAQQNTHESTSSLSKEVAKMIQQGPVTSSNILGPTSTL